MEAFVEQAGRGGYAVAGLVFLVLGAWQIHAGALANRARTGLVAALLTTAAWALFSGAMGWGHPLSAGLETLRNMGWLFFMFLLLDQAATVEQPRGVRLIYYALFAIMGAELALDAVIAVLLLANPDASAQSLALIDVAFFGALVLRMIVAVGALLLVHNLYTVTAPDLRWGISLPMAALAALWTWDLNLYTIAYLGGELPFELQAMRGPALCVLAPVIALGLGRNRHWKLRLSRSVAFQSVSLFVIGAYLVAMVILAGVIERLGGNYVRLAQLGLVFGMSLLALLVLPSGRFRAWMNIKIAKHFFQHRYDYRAEWERFTETLGQPGEGAESLDSRIVQAIGDILESPAGLLMTPGDGGRFAVQARWNWRGDDHGTRQLGEGGRLFFEQTGHVVELDAVREDRDPRCDPAAVPEWLWHDPRAWVIVPLIHFSQLRGLVVLARPRVERPLDWEDFDMLRAVGRQAASYLAEARGQTELIEARQFDEFNRRFAFIMHDIKNLVSQLSLVARNAERHADNPDFRADMIATLKGSVDKMNAMLARLSQHHRARPDEPRDVTLGPIVTRTAAGYQAGHPIELVGEDLAAHADPARLETILRHLIQNAIDASPSGTPVRVAMRRRGTMVAIDVIDEGSGMDEAFIRHELFKPFSSTKPDGFGIGAYEARALAEAMGGRIDVESSAGAGSRFSLCLPQARGPSGPAEPMGEAA